MTILSRCLLFLMVCSVTRFVCSGESDSSFAKKQKAFSDIFSRSVIDAQGNVEKDKVLRQGEALYNFVPEVVKEINRRNSSAAVLGGKTIVELQSFSVYYLYNPDSGRQIMGVEEEDSFGYKSTADGFAEINKNTALYLCYRPGWEELCSFTHQRFRDFVPTSNGKWYVQCIVGFFPSDDSDEDDKDNKVSPDVRQDVRIDLTPLADLPVDTLVLQRMPGKPYLKGVKARTVMLHGFAQEIKELSFLPEMSYAGLHIYACAAFNSATLKSCPEIESFTAEECGTFSDLSGFFHCPKIRKIELGSVEANTDLTPLQLPELQSLSLLIKKNKDGEYSDISPLRKVRSLRELAINVHDCSSLTGFDKIQKLSVCGGDKEGKLDLAGLESLKNLEELEILSKSVSKIEVIASLPIRKLTLPGGTDFTPLAGLKHLEKLVIRHGKDLSSLAKLSNLNLHELVVDDFSYSGDYSFLRNFRTISSLTAVRIKDLRCLTHLPLKYLDISYASTEDYSPLAELKGLVTLKLEDSPISDLTPLKGLKSLQYLNLYGARVKDITPIADLPLRYLNVIDEDEDDSLQNSPAVRKILSRFPSGVRGDLKNQ